MRLSGCASHLALQNDAGCDVGCKPDENTPAHVVMDIDWVKIYAVPRHAPAAPPAATSAAVTASAYSPGGTT